MAEMIGRTLGPYRVLEQLGVGGMATVYKAYHAAMDRYVAIKVLPEHLASDAGFRTRFEREARTIARLEHRHILPVYDVAEDNGIPYLVMRYTDGGDLGELIARGSLSIARAGELVAQVADALDYAHRQGVIHRDVKPANVLIGRDGDALLSDFGIAKIYSEAQKLTGDGMMVGTPAYMAPEQLKGEPVDARTDIYSLGVVLYQALTGECPFVAETPLAVAMMHVHNPLRPPRQLNPAIPEAFERVILRAMAKQADERFQDAGAMARALRAANTGITLPDGDTLPEAAASAVVPPVTPPITPIPVAVAVSAPVSSPLASPIQPGTNKRWLGIGAAVLALVLLGAAAFALLRGGAGGTTAGSATAAPADDIRQTLETAARQVEAGEVPAALRTLEPALVAHPDDPSLLAMRGIARMLDSGADSARPDIERALKLGPNNALAYFARGYLQERQGEADPAIADYTRAIELDPNFVRAYYQRSVLLSYPKDDQAGALRDLDRALALDPDFIPARMDRGWRLYYSDQLAPALADVEHVLKLNAQQAQALYLRALIATKQNRLADARRDFDAAVAAAPNDTGIVQARAEFLVRQGDYAAALADAERLVAQDAADANFHRFRGFTLVALKRYDEALAAFERELLINGNEDWAGRYGRGLALLGLGRAPDALADLQAAQAHPNEVNGTADLFFHSSDQATLDLARAYGTVGQTDHALATLDAAIERGAGAAAYLARGRLRATLGVDGARTDLQEALRLAVAAKDNAQQALIETELAKLP